MQKAILAYSGGLDTSCLIKWLQDKGYGVIAVIADVGQQEDFAAIKKRALKTGATKVYVLNLQKEFVQNYKNEVNITSQLNYPNIVKVYDADIEKAKGIIAKVADSAQWILKTPSPKVVVRNFGESSVDLQLRVWIKDARRRMDTISYITDKIKTEFDKEKIEIPYPKRDIIITKKPDN